MEHIRKEFPGVVALDDVHFDLRRGEVHVLLGENGAGKSTLVKILSGAYRMTSGEIRLSGDQTDIHNPHHAQELGISIIYQEFNLVPHLSAAENIFLGRERIHTTGLIDQKRIVSEAHRVLDGLGVKIDVRRAVGDLGVAQQQMVEVAKALSQDARILIMDEPTSALTEYEIKELFAAIRQLKAEGVAVIYISHRLEELFEIGDRVTVLRDGKYVGTYDIGDVSKSELITMMVDRELKEHFPKVKAKPGEEVLRIENLSTKEVLRNVNLSLRRGEVLGVAGLLGSGRTELARALFGIDRVDRGTITIRGGPRSIRSPRQAINQGIGFLTEDRKSQGLIMVLSLKDNICLPSVDQFSRFGFMNGKAEAQAAEQSIQDLRIKTPSISQQVMNLSGGNQQKVVISKWLCRHADILIFDEPTRGIDVGSKVEIYQLMNKLTARGAAIIMISSELPEILGMSDRIAVMNNGRIAGEFAAGEATQEIILQAALGVT
ncbi:MAG: sugar ABC transporter ATP-binding protein [Fidelibacterota bacterium]|nr:MAG: sugar ABC transporter ATP-binding protein [Candidatus Neomarinimicrobiota bacterium]